MKRETDEKLKPTAILGLLLATLILYFLIIFSITYENTKITFEPYRFENLTVNETIITQSIFIPDDCKTPEGCNEKYNITNFTCIKDDIVFRAERKCECGAVWSVYYPFGKKSKARIVFEKYHKKSCNFGRR